MVETAFYIWLLGAALIFVTVAMSGQATERSQAIWLLILAASWPVVLLFMAVGAVLLAISAGQSTKP